MPRGAQFVDDDADQFRFDEGIGHVLDTDALSDAVKWRNSV